MTTHRLIQNFRRSQGLLWASPELNADVLERTLLKLGVSLWRVESVSASDLDHDRDIAFVDADQPINPAPLLQPGANFSVAPVIGIVGVEAPSRLKLLAEAGATAILRKPIQAATVYSAIFLGVNNHRRLKSAETRLAIGDRKRRGRRFLHSKTGGVDLHPATDAPVVARMPAAGAVILGKTNIPVLSATGSHANDS